MRLPRKGILIRLCIYVPLLLFFGWGALKKYRVERDEKTAEQAERAGIPPPGERRTMPLPGGGSIEVFEVSEEQARQMGIERPPEPAADAKAPASPAPAEAKSPAAPAPGAN